MLNAKIRESRKGSTKNKTMLWLEGLTCSITAYLGKKFKLKKLKFNENRVQKGRTFGILSNSPKADTLLKFYLAPFVD